MISRRRVLFCAAATAAASAAPWVHAQPGSDTSFPQRPISLWVPWPAGGATDVTLRLLADLAGRQLGQRILIENRGGAGGTLAMPVLQQAPPDGYTLAQMPQPVFRAPHTQKVAWDPIRDTTPILQISGVTFGLVVPAASALRSVDDLLGHAAAHPGELSIATNGIGTTPHVVLDGLFARHGLSYIHVPYKGTAEQMVAVASDQVMAGVNSNGFAPYVDSGRLRLLATFGAARTGRWPNVPTLDELGHGIVAMSPYGLAGPRGLPASVLRTLHDAFKTALFDPRHIAELARYDQEIAYLGSADYGRSMRESFAAQQRIVERLGLRPGQE
ncbi:Tripartite-type tricarboxylate transporter, receptor component TctC [Variovorax sp. CF079]|uniref:tripartite tricarboxylate transporter substrate binding protein n=1 Tax=Variovorax sp. CF079 TaxID=1882774 RepID=UPI00088CCB7E|nr:tripartite tricarboxylate transporter substrate binding protein [Variovorax sp. CF079]SDE46595.1 Tripartite-type tricarboxylate transporter, receptor component TctC [Variovorax sp. CF079]